MDNIKIFDDFLTDDEFRRCHEIIESNQWKYSGFSCNSDDNLQNVGKTVNSKKWKQISDSLPL